MEAAKVRVSGDGLAIGDAVSHPAGTLFSSGYDSGSNTLYLSSLMGHPRGVSAAGGEPDDRMSGMRVLMVGSGMVYWATDSMSLPRGLSESESEAVAAALQMHFAGKTVRRVEKLEDIPR